MKKILKKDLLQNLYSYKDKFNENNADIVPCISEFFKYSNIPEINVFFSNDKIINKIISYRNNLLNNINSGKPLSRSEETFISNELDFLPYNLNKSTYINAILRQIFSNNKIVSYNLFEKLIKELVSSLSDINYISVAEKLPNNAVAAYYKEKLFLTNTLMSNLYESKKEKTLESIYILFHELWHNYQEILIKENPTDEFNQAIQKEIEIKNARPNIYNSNYLRTYLEKDAIINGKVLANHYLSLINLNEYFNLQNFTNLEDVIKTNRNYIQNHTPQTLIYNGIEFPSEDVLLNIRYNKKSN